MQNNKNSIRLYRKTFSTRAQISNWLHKCGIKEYSIDEEMRVSVEGHLLLEGFNCSHNQLTSLVGGPVDIDGYYSCTHNLLKTLEGAPLKADHFMCYENPLKDFQHCPKFIKDTFQASGKELVSLEYLPKEVGENVMLYNCHHIPEANGHHSLEQMQEIEVLRTRRLLQSELDIVARREGGVESKDVQKIKI